LQLDGKSVLVIGIASCLVLLAFFIIERQQGGLLEALLDVDRVVEAIGQPLAEGGLSGGDVSADDAY
jgi:hypothetical protein